MLANSGYFKTMILFGDIPKGDLISKCLFGVFDSTKNERKQFDMRYHSNKVELF